MSRGAVLVAAAALVLLAGCGGGGAAGDTPSPSAPASGTDAAPPSVVAPSTPATSGPPTASGQPTSTSTALVPGADCLTGTWRLVRFVGLGASATYGTGQGGDVAITFDDGRYDLVGRGERPITVNLAGEGAQLTIDGTAAGSYRPQGSSMAFTVDRTSGQGTLQAGSQRRTLPMSSISQVIAPRGTATLACPQGVLLIALPTVRLELER